MELNNSLLNSVLTNISNFKDSKNCSEFVQQISVQSQNFREIIIDNASVKPEILKMRIGV